MSISVCVRAVLSRCTRLYPVPCDAKLWLSDQRAVRLGRRRRTGRTHESTHLAGAAEARAEAGSSSCRILLFIYQYLGAYIVLLVLRLYDTAVKAVIHLWIFFCNSTACHVIDLRRRQIQCLVAMCTRQLHPLLWFPIFSLQPTVSSRHARRNLAHTQQHQRQPPDRLR